MALAVSLFTLGLNIASRVTLSPVGEPEIPAYRLAVHTAVTDTAPAHMSNQRALTVL